MKTEKLNLTEEWDKTFLKSEKVDHKKITFIKTYEEELVEDVLSVITVFSARLYGSRSHKAKKIVDESKKLFE